MIPVPHDAAATGIPRSLLHDLVVRRTLFDGETSTLQIADQLKLSPLVAQELIEELRDLRIVEIVGLERRNQLLRLTLDGSAHARERLGVSRYAGPAPVTLAEYERVVYQQRPNTDIDAGRMRSAFADLVMSDHLLDELGPAFRAQGAMFLYGPPGTGKSAIAERLDRAYEDPLLVPHAVELDGQIVSLFDPLVHHPLPASEGVDHLDPRWVWCARPCIIAGGELKPAQLDLEWDGGSGTYRAPLQLQANGGVLVIDDFGRQVMTPEALLNRWILPLDRNVDYLTLAYGAKVRVPFTPKVVFSTNLEPETLGDEAFFRRMRSKVLIPPIDADQFDEVLRRVVRARGINVAAGTPAYLRQMAREKGDGDLRAYLPGAVCDLVESICDYDHRPRVLDPPMVDRVVELYFTQATRPDQEVRNHRLRAIPS